MDEKENEAPKSSAPARTENTRTGNATEEAADRAVVCSLCGEAAEDSIDWACSVENGNRRYFCASCARTHIRAIEGRIDSAWW